MTYDFAPLFRTAIGFDRVLRLVDTAANAASSTASYPPYNIEKIGDSDYTLTMALAGFCVDDIEVLLVDNNLVIKAAVPRHSRQGELLHRGIATRAFEKRFALADHIEIRDASLANGLLEIQVRRIVPETAKPRRIPVTAGTSVVSDSDSSTSASETSVQAA